MKKLNNEGWGLSTFITFIAVFLIFILVVVILSHDMRTDNNAKNNVYKNNTALLLR